MKIYTHIRDSRNTEKNEADEIRRRTLANKRQAEAETQGGKAEEDPAKKTRPKKNKAKI